MQKNITPLPWITVPHRSDNGQMRAIVAQAPGGYGMAITGWGSVTQKPDDAAFIVKACNSHDELVSALRTLLMACPLSVKIENEAEFNAARAILRKVEAS